MKARSTSGVSTGHSGRTLCVEIGNKERDNKNELEERSSSSSASIYKMKAQDLPDLPLWALG